MDGRRPAGYCLLLIGTMTWLLSACSTMPEFMRTAPPSPPRSKTFTVLTYNTLHGLEVGKFWVRQIETDERYRARFTWRIKQLAEAQSDVILLQEVNPLPAMAHDYVGALAQQGLHYAEVHQVDACGLRLAPGLAILPGLNNGLVILAKAPLTIRKLDGLKLSDEESFGLKLLRRASEEPLRQIARNAGVEAAVVLGKVLDGKDAFGFNAATNTYEDLLKAGVLDPAKVTRSALQNAASIAALFLTTEAVVTEKPEKEKAPAMPGGGDMDF